ncbi:MAG: response regulator [Acidobacteria bacterium]|nr:response regulator [Acidobacteriota bacterium]
MVVVSFPHRNDAGIAAENATPQPPAPVAAEGGKFTERREKTPTRRVLVVDDELLIRWSLNEGLARAGFEVVEAEDARGALQRFTPDAPAVHAVLLDLRLPDSADLGLLRQIRQLAPATPVIMMTAYGSPETTEDALRLGAFHVVSKPFDLHHIVTLVEDAVGEA